MKRNKKQANSVNRKQVSHVNLDLQTLLSESNWRKAAEDTRLKIKVYQEKIRRLKLAAKAFEKYDRQGEPWPGDEVVGQNG